MWFGQPNPTYDFGPNPNFFLPVNSFFKNHRKSLYCSLYGSVQFCSSGIVAWVITGRSYNCTSATSGRVFNHPIFCGFFPISALKVMDSVSVLLNIIKLKCELAAELRTFKILNCSLSFEKLESRFYVIQQSQKKDLPTLPNVFSAVTQTTQLFILALAIFFLGCFVSVYL